MERTQTNYQVMTGVAPDKHCSYFTSEGELMYNSLTGNWWTIGLPGKIVVPKWWLKPRPDTVLMTREEVEANWRKGYDEGFADRGKIS